MTAIDYRDPNVTPPLGQAIPLGFQHVLAMFASNVTPSIIVAGAAIANEAPDLSSVGRLVGGKATWISVDGDQIAFGTGRALRLARGIDVPLLEQELQLKDSIESAVLVTGELYVASGTQLGRLSLERPSAAPSPKVYTHLVIRFSVL